MLVKYCSKCAGRPYTENCSMTNCPTCNGVLSCEMVDVSSLNGRPTLSVPQKNNLFGNNSSAGTEKQNPGSSGNNFFTPNTTILPPESTTVNTQTNNSANNIAQSSVYGNTGIQTKNNSNSGSKTYGDRSVLQSGNVVSGKVSQYSSTGKEDGNYRRLFVQKLMDAILYKQRFEDILHRFKVRVKSSPDAFGNCQYIDVQVNAHGTISGGAQITDNSEVEVFGKYRNGVLMARKINIINNGYRTPVNFQHSAKAIFYGILAIVAAFFMIYIGLSSDGGFFQNIGSFLKTWLITSVIVTVLYFLLSFSKIGIMTRMASGRPRRFPIVGVLLVSLVLTLIFVNSFGLGASVGSWLSGLLSSVISVVVVLVVLFVIFKLILGLF